MSENTDNSEIRGLPLDCIEQIFKLLEAEAGLTPDEVDKYFTITKKEKDFVLKLKGVAWLESSIRRAMQELVEKTRGSYTAKPETFTFPEESLVASNAQTKPSCEEAKAEAAEPKPSKPVNHESVGASCPLCMSRLSREKYERLKKKFGEKYLDLFSDYKEKSMAISARSKVNTGTEMK